MQKKKKKKINSRLEEVVITDVTCAGHHVLSLTWSSEVMLTLPR